MEHTNGSSFRNKDRSFASPTGGGASPTHHSLRSLDVTSPDSLTQNSLLTLPLLWDLGLGGALRVERDREMSLPLPGVRVRAAVAPLGSRPTL